jgi:hypothetical protein
MCEIVTVGEKRSKGITFVCGNHAGVDKT